MRRRRSLSRPPVLCMGVWGSVDMAVWVASCGGCCGNLLSSRLHRDLLNLTPAWLPVPSTAPRGLVLVPVVVCTVFIGRRRCLSVGAVNGVASLPVGAVQRQRERDPAVPKLTRTDAGRPATQKQKGRISKKYLEGKIYRWIERSRSSERDKGNSSC